MKIRSLFKRKETRQIDQGSPFDYESRLKGDLESFNYLSKKIVQSAQTLNKAYIDAILARNKMTILSDTKSVSIYAILKSAKYDSSIQDNLDNEFASKVLDLTQKASYLLQEYAKNPTKKRNEELLPLLQYYDVTHNNQRHLALSLTDMLGIDQIKQSKSDEHEPVIAKDALTLYVPHESGSDWTNYYYYFSQQIGGSKIVARTFSQSGIKTKNSEYVKEVRFNHSIFKVYNKMLTGFLGGDKPINPIPNDYTPEQIIDELNTIALSLVLDVKTLNPVYDSKIVTGYLDKYLLLSQNHDFLDAIYKSDLSKLQSIVTPAITSLADEILPSISTTLKVYSEVKTQGVDLSMYNEAFIKIDKYYLALLEELDQIASSLGITNNHILQRVDSSFELFMNAKKQQEIDKSRIEKQSRELEEIVKL